ncbi:hypothetical protein DITRI_Ditri18aG0057400 [Diplodiscus trichospermus]
MVDEAQDPHSNFSRETVLDITLFSIIIAWAFLGLTGFALPKPVPLRRIAKNHQVHPLMHILLLLHKTCFSKTGCLSAEIDDIVLQMGAF